MKKVLALLLTLTLTLSMSLCAFAASDKSNNGKGKGANKSDTQTVSTSVSEDTAPTGTIWSNKPGNLVKLYPDDGKKVMFPVQALLNNGAEKVDWSFDEGTVTVTGTNGITVVFTPNSTTATTKASVALGDTSAVTLTVSTDTTDPTINTISGNLSANITDPLTGDLITVPLTISGSVSDYVAATETTSATGTIEGGTFSGVYTDPLTGVEKTISGTITGDLSNYDLALDTTSQSIDFAIPFENEISNGRAYVPIQDLDKLFATQLTADTATEAIPTEEPAVPTI